MLSRFKNHDIREPSQAKLAPNGVFIDRLTGERGIALEVKSVTINGNTARVQAGYFSGAGVTYDLELTKEVCWMIKSRSAPTIAE